MENRDWTFPLSVAMDSKTLRQLERLAAVRRQSRSRIIRDLIAKEASVSAKTTQRQQPQATQRDA